MNKLELAVVPSTMSLPKALAHIRKGTRAVVVHFPELHPLLVTAGDIMAACNDAVDQGMDPKKKPVGEVIPAHRPAVAPGHAPVYVVVQPSHFGLNAVAGTPVDTRTYETLFAETDDRYAVHEIENDTAVVVTASEDFAAALNTGVTICRCVGTPVHTFEPRQLLVPNQCNKPHAAKVRCMKVDSSP